MEQKYISERHGRFGEIMICELCGKDVPRLHKVVIEGVIMNVCDECAKFGKEAEEKEERLYGRGRSTHRGLS